LVGGEDKGSFLTNFAAKPVVDLARSSGTHHFAQKTDLV